MERAGAKVILMRLKRSKGMLSLMVKLRKLLNELEPDIVHIQYIAPGLVPITAARLSGIETIFATVHQPGRTYGWKPKLLIRIASHLCTAFFCNSRAVEKSWFGNSEIFNPEKIDSKRKHFTIYNGVDISKIEKIVKEADTEKIKESLGIRNKKVIGAVGRLRSEKGHSVLLNAFGDLVKILPNCVLLIVGDGPDRVHLEEMGKELGIRGYVKWLGQKDHDEVLGLYSIMDVVVVPSLFEGFGLTAAEAMAASRPVVASKVDGLMEMMQDGVNSFIVSPGDSRGLASAILELLLNPEKATSMGARGRQLVVNEFSLERFQSAIPAAYGHYVSRPDKP
jgi:glycosyltransferase involved in cell wall biosynthesis